MSEPPEHGEPARARLRRDLAGAAACALVGLVLATLPHGVWWLKRGEAVWYSDYDDLLYVSYAARSYVHHPFRLTDPAYPGERATHYPWLQFVPGELIARAFRLGPERINIVWRCLAGLLIGAAWFAALHAFVRDRRVAAGLGILLLADGGLFSGLPVVKNAWVFLGLLTGRSADVYLGTVPMLCYQWRIITPGLSLPFLLAHVALLARARACPTRARLLASGVGFGLLFPTYFYYWTAASLALVLAWVLDAGRRSVYAHTAWIGALIGLPTLIAGSRLRASAGSDWLERADYFVTVPRWENFQPHPSLALIAVALPWVWLRRKDCLYAWSLAATGGLLVSHHVISGLEIQNFHWTYVRGPILAILLLVLTWDQVSRLRLRFRTAAKVVLAFACAGQFGAGLIMRATEAVRARSVREIMADLERYEAQRSHPSLPRLARNSVVAGDPAFLNFAAVSEDARPLAHLAVFYGPGTNNEQWDARLALNAYLLGLDRRSFAASEDALLDNPDQRLAFHGGAFGRWKRDAGARAERLSRRRAAFERVLADPPAAVRRFSVRYVAEPGTSAVPEARRVGWKRLQDGPHWRVWEFVGARSQPDEHSPTGVASLTIEGEEPGPCTASRTTNQHRSTSSGVSLP